MSAQTLENGPEAHATRSLVSLGDSSVAENGGLLAGYLSQAVRKNASDLLLIAKAPPTICLHGQWLPLQDQALSTEEVTACVEAVLTDSQRATLYQARDLDFGFALPGSGRFRANVHYQRGALAAAFRAIPDRVPHIDQLGLPQSVRYLGGYPNGLVLVTGCTGQGKSTTLAAVVDYMNQTRSAHVITIEDPIEFSFDHGTCLIEQRQIGDDSPSFASALRHVVRQRPDVILIGEMRDTETIATALTAAETGHLVLASLHPSSAAKTLARIIDAFPPVQQPQIRTQIAASLRVILCQSLVRDRLNDALTPATEFLVATSAVRRAIRDNETHLIYSMMETGRRSDMHTLEQSLAALVKDRRIEPGVAFTAAADALRLEKLIGHPAPADHSLLPAVPARSAGPIEIPWNGNPV